MSIVKALVERAFPKIATPITKNEVGQLVGENIVQPDWNQSDPAAADYVQNRTHYDSEHIFTIDEDFVNSAITIDGSEFKDSEGNTYINLVNDKWVRISELTPSLDTLWNTGYVRRTNATSGCPIPSWGGSILWDTDDFYAIGSTMRVTYGYLFVVFKAGATISFGSSAGTAQDKYKAIAPEPGIYMNVNCSASTGEYTPLLEYIKWGKLVPLDEKYIPDTIARKSDLEGLGGGGGSNHLLILWDNESIGGAITANMTYEEIRSLYDSGKIPTCIVLKSVDDYGTIYVKTVVPTQIGCHANSFQIFENNSKYYMYRDDGSLVCEAD